MNFDHFTIKSQEALQEAVNLVQSNGQQSVEAAHLLSGVIKVGENVVKFIFSKLGMNLATISTVLEKQVSSYPRVQGGQPYLSNETNEVLNKANDFIGKMGDEYVSLEHLILALLIVKSPASDILKDAGMNEKDLRAAITELRKGNWRVSEIYR